MTPTREDIDNEERLPMAESITNAVMNLVDRLGSEAANVDPRAWEHLKVYLPKPAFPTREEVEKLNERLRTTECDDVGAFTAIDFMSALLAENERLQRVNDELAIKAAQEMDRLFTENEELAQVEKELAEYQQISHKQFTTLMDQQGRLAQLRDRLTGCKSELKEIAIVLDDPRTHNTLTIAEVIKDLKGQLATVTAERDMWKATSIRDAKRVDELIADLAIQKAGKDSLKAMVKDQWAAADTERDALKKDAERYERCFEWLLRNLFDCKWGGTIGEPMTWHIRGDYRHTMQKLRGTSFLDAIDAAMKKGEA